MNHRSKYLIFLVFLFGFQVNYCSDVSVLIESLRRHGLIIGESSDDTYKLRVLRQPDEFSCGFNVLKNIIFVVDFLLKIKNIKDDGKNFKSEPEVFNFFVRQLKDKLESFDEFSVLYVGEKIGMQRAHFFDNFLQVYVEPNHAKLIGNFLDYINKQLKNYDKIPTLDVFFKTCEQGFKDVNHLSSADSTIIGHYRQMLPGYVEDKKNKILGDLARNPVKGSWIDYLKKEDKDFLSDRSQGIFYNDISKLIDGMNEKECFAPQDIFENNIQRINSFIFSVPIFNPRGSSPEDCFNMRKAFIRLETAKICAFSFQQQARIQHFSGVILFKLGDSKQIRFVVDSLNKDLKIDLEQLNYLHNWEKFFSIH